MKDWRYKREELKKKFQDKMNFLFKESSWGGVIVVLASVLLIMIFFN
jgi:hypothetical protein